MTTKLRLIAALLLCCFLSGCENFWMEELVGHLIKNGESGFGTGILLGYDLSGAGADILSALEYRITLTDFAGVETHITVKGVTSAKLTAAPGSWDIKVEAWFDSLLFAEGSDDVEVTEGENSAVTITLEQIFTVSPENCFVVSSAAKWNTACDAIKDGGNGKEYAVFLTENIMFAASNYNAFGANTGITVSIYGNKTMTQTAAGNVIHVNTNHKIIVQDVKMAGNSNNNTSAVYVSAGGELIMQGSASVSGNIVNNIGGADGKGGGVCVDGSGRFTMKDSASVSGNTTFGNGGGVAISNNGINGYGTFTMQGSASVSGNTANGSGGGVYVDNGSAFRLEGGAVNGNTAAGNGNQLYKTTSGTAQYGDNSAISLEGTDGTGTYTDNSISR